MQIGFNFSTNKTGLRFCVKQLVFKSLLGVFFFLMQIVFFQHCFRVNMSSFPGSLTMEKGGEMDNFITNLNVYNSSSDIFQ